MRVVINNQAIFVPKGSPKVGDVYRNTKNNLHICFKVDESKAFCIGLDKNGELSAVVRYYLSYLARSHWKRVGKAVIPTLKITLDGVQK